MIRFVAPTFAVVAISGLLTGCVSGEKTMADKSMQPCGYKPNCVSTQDERQKYTLSPFLLSSESDIESIKTAALTLPGAKLAEQEEDYLRIECTSRFLRFVDDLELRIDQGKLIVRSQSRLGYSDFGVNRARADALRAALANKGLLK
ncbi:hypothetical protein CS022_20920 [Veronia nyctiphanis]|uniref:DUF1499 domain-containing protein n=1 Tax=Veronia nyctiphanis TaxID=1278244 RepID=A0A4Q0YM37_9GAMM|nr:DUF1499 domain-containing protein [Veronia nyctiphanis]RXJ71445.1 hypothetical protein CS022_20920 [Veronia nyctiphanis]